MRRRQQTERCKEEGRCCSLWRACFLERAGTASAMSYQHLSVVHASACVQTVAMTSPTLNGNLVIIAYAFLASCLEPPGRLCLELQVRCMAPVALCFPSCREYFFRARTAGAI